MFRGIRIETLRVEVEFNLLSELELYGRKEMKSELDNEIGLEL